MEDQQQWKLVPVEPTEEMVAAYLQANGEYWARTDEIPPPPHKWRTGTPSAATAAGYSAMLAASPSSSVLERAREEALRQGIRRITQLLRDGEWADLLTADLDLSGLEEEIGKLIGARQ